MVIPGEGNQGELSQIHSHDDDGGVLHPPGMTPPSPWRHGDLLYFAPKSRWFVRELPWHRFWSDSRPQGKAHGHVEVSNFWQESWRRKMSRMTCGCGGPSFPAEATHHPASQCGWWWTLKFSRYHSTTTSHPWSSRGRRGWSYLRLRFQILWLPVRWTFL